MSDAEEREFLESLILVGDDADWADFWASEDPSEVLMNDKKLEEVHG